MRSIISRNHEKAAGKLWNESKESEFIQDQAHWRGIGRWENDENWINIGKSRQEMYQKLEQILPFKPNKNTMVEWGPGGGSNILAFSNEFKEIVGVDISSETLKQCINQVKSIENFKFIPELIEADQPELIRENYIGYFDFFLSTAVYQHFPSKQYAKKINQIAYDLLKDNGTAIIQIRYDDNNWRYHSKLFGYRKKFIAFTSFGISEFNKNLEKIGFVVESIILKSNTNYAYFLLRK